MYADPKRIRNKRVVIYINEYEFEDLQSRVADSGGEQAVIARERYLRGAESDLHAMESAGSAHGMRAPHQAFA